MNIAIIPARGGSKGIPRKNMSLLGGVPLVSWSIIAAKNSGLFDRVIVSSDDSEILGVASSLYVEQMRRPESLSGDMASTDDLLKFMCAEMDHCDKVVLLQPTSPFRYGYIIKDCLSELSVCESAMSVSRLHFVWWCWSDDGRYVTNAESVSSRPRRQDMDRKSIMYSESGSVYAFRAGLVINRGARISGKSNNLVEHKAKFEAIDIDTADDLSMANAVVSSGLFSLGDLGR